MDSPFFLSIYNNSCNDYTIFDRESERCLFNNGKLLTFLLYIFLAYSIKYENERRCYKKGTFGIPQLNYIDLIEYLPCHFTSPEIGGLQALYECMLTYGKIFQVSLFGLSFTIVNSPELIQKVLMSHNLFHLNKPKILYQSMFDKFENGLVSSDVDVWSPHRKAVSRAFNYQAIQRYFTQINFYTRQMLDTIAEKVDKKESLIVSAVINHTVAKTVLYFIIGPHNCTEEEVANFNEAIEMSKDISAYRVTRPWLLIQPIWWLHPFSRKRTHYVHKAEHFGREIIQRSREKLAGLQNPSFTPSCMIEEMLVKGMSDDEITDEFAILIAAGTETTSMSINFFLFLLALHPEHQELCRNEVDVAFDEKISDSCDLTMDDLCSFKHLERCMLEAQRMASTIPLFLRRIDQPLKLDANLELEVGEWVLISPWALHRHPRYYPNPEKFDPDRFLPENCKARHPYAFIPFSAGPRNCIGWKLANIQTKVVIAWILRKFEIHTSDRLEDIRFKFSVSLATEREINLSFKKRVDHQMLK